MRRFCVIKICFLSSWGESPKDLLVRYSLQTPNGDGVWEDIVGVSNIEESDFCFILGGNPKDDSVLDKIPDNKKVFLQREPDYLLSSDVITSNCSYKNFSYKNGFQAAIWWINKKFKEIENFKHIKNKKASSIISGKNFCKGHSERLDIVERYCLKYPKTIDFYGRGIKSFAKDSYKGEINNDKNCKFEGLSPYFYSLCCENGKLENYLTEKIYDSFLCETFPIYWGCPNIFNYFPEESLCCIDSCEDIDAIYRRIESPLESFNIKALREAKRLVLYKYNLWPTIKRIIDTGEMI